MKLKVLIQPEAEGGYSASVPGMQGCYSEGETLQETLDNIREAADLWLEVQSERAERESADADSQLVLQEIEL